MSEYIKIKGARQHNLKNIDLKIPKNKLVVFTGVSGSGKSSLAFDTIFAEGQRRYVESLSTYARQFLGVMKKPDVDLIEGLSPSISIDQKTVSHNPRSTVGTVTEIYDYLRLLFARIGHPHCPICGDEIASQSLDQITGGVQNLIKNSLKTTKVFRFLILTPLVNQKKGSFVSLFENLKGKGLRRVRIDGIIKDLSEDFVLLKNNKHTIEAVIDRLSVSSKDLKGEVNKKIFESRLTDSIEKSLKLSDGLVLIAQIKDKGFQIPDFPKNFEDSLFSEKFACPKDNIQLPEIAPRTFSFNSPQGACQSCSGIGSILKVNPKILFAKELSIKEGGIIPFSYVFEHDTWLGRTILVFCEANDIPVNIPIKNLTAKQMKTLLNGTKGKIYTIDGETKSGSLASIKRPFDGLVGELERRYLQTSSDYIRHGIEKYMTQVTCPTCEGARLNKQALSITIDKKSIVEVSNMTISGCLAWVENLKLKNLLNKRESQIAQLIIKEIITRLTFLNNVGLNYLTLGRSAGSLAGGEAQRIRLASQIGTGLTGVLYVLDEPTIGLHPRDNKKLIDTLKNMRDLGNTIIVVEHDKEIMENADYIFDFGPGAGKHGGGIVAQGKINQIKKDKDSLTGKYLSGKKKISFQTQNGLLPRGSLKLTGASQYNLKNVNVDIPMGKLVVITGVSGSGKSTLVVETLYHALKKKLNPHSRVEPGIFKTLTGTEEVDKVSLIDQSPIGRTPRSNPATYTKVFDPIRDVFAATREAKAQGFNKGRFSFNVKGGRCETCEGQGKIKIEMQFMPNIWINCEVCKGARYNSATLEVTYKGKSIAEVLKMTVDEATEFFHVYNPIVQKLKTLQAVGLGYMELGQSATTLSGGEAQRVKLATELSKKATGNTVYILDEPTTGLHFADLKNLLTVLKLLVEKGNSVIVIEHNLDVIKNADWIIDLGPEGGLEGGKIVASGTPDTIKNGNTHTGKFLANEKH